MFSPLSGVMLKHIILYKTRRVIYVNRASYAAVRGNSAADGCNA
jgi:hypothetical protein